jgi:hypothetical protein
MVTTDEIQRRIEEADAARSAKRSAAAQQVGELAQRRAALAEELEDLERQLGDVLAAARDVMDVEELARFTDVPVADLTRWLEARKTPRTKRKKPAGGGPGAKNGTRPSSSAATPGQASTLPEPAVAPLDTADGRIPADVT